MRILFVTDSLMAGGIESQLVELALRLDCKRFQPHVLCLYGPSARDLHFAPDLRRANIPLFTPDLGWTVRDKISGVGHILATARRVQPDIIQAEGYHANLLTRLAFPLLPRTAVIGSVRGIHTRKQLFYERLSHRACKVIAVNAPQLKPMLIDGAHVPGDKVVYIPSGIDIARYAAPRDAQFRMRLASEARRVFVSIGRVSFEKNLHWTVEAFGLLKRSNRLPQDVRLVLVGPVQDAEAQALLDTTVDRFGLHGTVLQHPATPYPQDYYHAADACILFSPNEGLPSVSIEALAAGRPTIVSDAANAAGVIEHGMNGWVVPVGSIPQLAEAVRAVITMTDGDLARMRQACIERARRFSVEVLAARYGDLYDTVTNVSSAFYSKPQKGGTGNQ